MNDLLLTQQNAKTLINEEQNAVFTLASGHFWANLSMDETENWLKDNDETHNFDKTETMNFKQAKQKLVVKTRMNQGYESTLVPCCCSFPVQKLYEPTGEWSGEIIANTFIQE